MDHIPSRPELNKSPRQTRLLPSLWSPNNLPTQNFSHWKKKKVMNAVNPRGVPLSMSKFCHLGPSKVYSCPATQHLRTTQSLVSNSHTLPLGIASGLKPPGVSDLSDTAPNHCVK